MLPDFTDIIAAAAEAFDDVLTTATPCTLIYQGIMEECANCIYDSIGKKSAGRYRDGGPLSFNDGAICPVCGGGGIRLTENSETIRMTIDHDLTGERKKFQRPLPNVSYTDTTIRTRGKLVDLPKIQKCVEMTIADVASPYYNLKYTLISEPVDNFVFVRNKYFTAFWKRSG